MRLDFDGVCAPVPTDEGAACHLAGCANGMKCEMPRCVRVRENGEACETRTECASTLCNMGVCAAPMLCGS